MNSLTVFVLWSTTYILPRSTNSFGNWKSIAKNGHIFERYILCHTMLDQNHFHLHSTRSVIRPRSHTLGECDIMRATWIIYLRTRITKLYHFCGWKKLMRGKWNSLLIKLSCGSRPNRIDLCQNIHFTWNSSLFMYWTFWKFITEKWYGVPIYFLSVKLLSRPTSLEPKILETKWYK